MNYKTSELLDKRNALLKLMNIEIRDVENKYEHMMTELLKDCDHMFDDGTPAVRINYTSGNSCRICGKYLPKPQTDLDSKKELIQELKAILCNTELRR
ncbi:MAG: hypothetical protein GX660_25690 [Clostridiaceae bacterium]|nr:hypothetical protein [Clostridiaceae bacterium]